MKRKLITAAVLILAVALLWAALLRRPAVSIHIDPEDVQYVIVIAGGFGPYRLDYSEHQERIDNVIATVNGDYRYIKLWNYVGTDANPAHISFYNDRGERVGSVSLTGSYLAVPRRLRGHYFLYLKNGDDLKYGGHINLEEFEKFARTYGTFAG